MSNNGPKYVALALSAGLTLLGIYTISVEYPAFIKSRVGFSDRAAALIASSGDNLPLSARAVQEQVFACVTAQTDFRAFTLPTEISEQLPQACDAIAQSAHSRLPNLAEAHFASAVSAKSAGRFDDAVESLVSSRDVAPQLAWLAQMRVSVISDMLDGAESSTLSDLLEDDLTLLASGRQGVRVLARFYNFDESLRPVVTRVVERLDEREQRRFVDLVRRINAETQI